jgi:uncharacterized RDD family membrane protein YckC
MSNEAIERAEPLVVAPLRQGPPVRLSQVRVWRRGFARLIDVMLHGAVMFSLAGIAVALMNPVAASGFFRLLEQMPAVVDQVLTVLLSTVLSALLLAFTGGSFGKALLGIRVRKADGSKPDLPTAINRECRVTWQGLAIGIPYISIGFAFWAFQDLRKKGTAKWDRALDLEVSYREDSPFQWGLTAVGAILCLAIVIYGYASQFLALSGR